MKKQTTILALLSVAIAFLVFLASTLGILVEDTYAQETPNWALQGIGQDIGNLLALPVFLSGLFWMWYGSVRARHIWMGALLYFVYAYLLYALFIHFQYLFLVYTAILGLTVFTLIGGIDLAWESEVHYDLPTGKRRPAGILLIIIGMLFGSLWMSEIIPALIAGEVPGSAAEAGFWVNPVHVIDLSMVLPGMILTGIKLLRDKQVGYRFAGPFLMFSVLMGTSILATLALELLQGNAEAVFPLVMVGIIVLASTIVLIQFLGAIVPREQ